MVDIDAVDGVLSVRLSDEELAARRAAWTPRAPGVCSGAIWKYAQGVSSARTGAVTHPGGGAGDPPYADV